MELGQDKTAGEVGPGKVAFAAGIDHLRYASARTPALVSRRPNKHEAEESISMRLTKTSQTHALSSHMFHVWFPK